MGITLQTTKVLWSRAHNQCAFPGCEQPLTDEAKDAETGEIRTNPAGEQAHIRSHRPGGPRYDRDYQGDVHGYENLILLCPTHHAKIDANDGAEFTVNDLIQMRTTHETQAKRREVDATVRIYTAQQYGVDDKVLFEQVELNGPSVDAMFVDVPFSCHADAGIAELMQRIAAASPGDSDGYDSVDGQVVTGAAQALLHPDWEGNALLVGGPGQGKSTLLQYICQFYRARLLGREAYKGSEHQLSALTELRGVPIRLDLRKYASWAAQRSQSSGGVGKGKKKKRAKPSTESRWPTIEEYIASEITLHSAGREFSIQDLASLVATQPMLIALDGLDEVADIKHREQVSLEIVDTQNRLEVDAVNLVVLVATRPGGTTSALWSSVKFPRLGLRRLTHGLRLQYLQRWAKVAQLKPEAAEKLQRTFMDNHNVPHIQELASYPMQLAILLHLLHRRQLLPQQRTELYSEYLKTFLDREQSGEKEPLLAEERQVIEDIHAFIGWHIHTQAEEGRTSGSIKRDALTKLIHEHLKEREDGQKLAEKLFAAFTTRVLCLVERDPGSFQFEVQSLREYFAALYIFDEVDRDKRDECLSSMLTRPYWSNVCRFFVGNYSKGEVRGMRHLLQYVSKDKSLALHPLLRSTAALFLNDRTYEGQREEPLQEIVDFILSGPGILLSEDGLLDAGGSGLKLSDRAGRIQAVRHLKDRIEKESDPGVRTAVAASLRRHATRADDLSRWWWARNDSTSTWLDTASQLRVLDELNPDDESQLSRLLAAHESDSIWATQLLVTGGYTGSLNDVLTIVVDEINDGAAEVIRDFAQTSPTGRILIGAHAAMFRSSENAIYGSKVPSRAHLPIEDHLMATIINAGEELRKQPSDTESDWYHRLARVGEVWGDGWVLRQAIAAVPKKISFPAIALLAQARHEVLHAALITESEARAHRRDTEWWKQQLGEATDGFMIRHWVFSLLTAAFAPVIVALASDLNRTVDELAPKHYFAIRNAISALQANPSVSRELALHDALRLNQATFSARMLWLARAGATEATVEQIDKRIAGSFGEFLATAPGDLRELARISGKTRAIKFDTFRGHRASLPTGGWASTIKLGTLSKKTAAEILQDPSQWPGDLVQRAVENVEVRMLANLTPLSKVAEDHSWFDS
ncbi:NACHT domain-containing NTPase [Rhodococcus wratislaviensis]|uniref:NACHT domain-containing protein n=1 Tax=Rhodococcus wratislaviensis TaxID=44752 RepID=UPI000F55D6DF|nr:HNH endonuclease [Rhodococcus wratislaviensis]